jgi:integrase
MERKRCSHPRFLGTISTPDVQAFTEWLATEEFCAYVTKYEVRRGKRAAVPMDASSVEQALGVLSGMFKYAISEGRLPPGANPVQNLVDRIPIPRSKTQMLEADDVAILIESARLYSPVMAGRERGCAFLHEMMAVYALTGARFSEGRRIRVEDIRFADQVVRIAGTKTTGSDRVIPLHQQLHDILLPFVKRLGRSTGLLFASSAEQRVVGNWSAMLNRVAIFAGFEPRSVSTRRLRVSYATHRLLSLDDGIPVTIEQVRQELGHASYAMLLKVYARVSRRKERLNPFEYRIERYADPMADRIATMKRRIEEASRGPRGKPVATAPAAM